MGTVSTQNEPKLTKLLERHKPGTVSLPSWLEGLGISRDLQKRYRRSGWLQSVGTGAFKRPNDDVQWLGGLYALQTQVNLLVHPGAITALALQGSAHYARHADETVLLFSPPKTPLPAWFKNYDWGPALRNVQTSMLPDTLGLVDHDVQTFTVRISTPERAMLECLYLAPDTLDLVECFQILGGLVHLRPKLVMSLLKECRSVKAKRLFLYMADKSKHEWVTHLDTTALDLGKGHRRVSKKGVFVAKYNLTIPKALADL